MLFAADQPMPSCHATPAGTPVSTATVSQAPSGDQWPPQVQVPTTVTDASNNGEHVKTVLFKGILIDRLYPSMRGPWTRQYVTLDPQHKTPYLWITRYRAEILDGQSGAASQEFMCHTNLADVYGEGLPTAHQNKATWFSISQGEKEIDFPKGFALRVRNTPDEQLDVNVMVLNNNYPDMHKALDFKATIAYIDDDQAKKRHLIPLFESGTGVNCPTVVSPLNHGDTVCQSATAFMVNASGDRRTGHWIVPPGRQEMRASVGMGLGLPYETTVHRIEMHVHPFAESMELRDKTTGQTVWKGKVQCDPVKAIVRSTEHYSDPTGILIHRDHEYEVVSIYNNTTTHPVDAMASLWMYFRDRSDERTKL